MTEVGGMLAIGAIVLVALVYLRRGAEVGAAGFWGWAWVSLGISAFHDGLVLPAPAGEILGVIAATLFPTFLLAGSYRFVERSMPRWLLVVAGMAAGLRVGLGLQDLHALSFAVAPLFEVPMCVGAAMLHWRASRDRSARLPERLLAPALIGIALLELVDTVIRVGGFEAAWLGTTWLVGAFGLFHIQILSEYDRRGRREGSLRTSRDREVQRREQQSLLLEAERRTLRAVLETAPVGVVVLDGEHRISLFNRTVAQHLRLEEPDLWLGSHVGEILARFREEIGSQPAIQTALQAMKANPAFVVQNLVFTTPDADARRLAFFSSPILSNRGESIGRVWVTRDVTEERRLEDDLRQAQKMETLGTLAGGVAQDFNNQLTAILGNARRLLDRGGMDNEARRCLEDLDQAAVHCAELTRGLLAFARRAPVTPQPVDLAKALAEAGSLLRATVPSSVRLETRIAQDVAPALADPTQLKQMLINLAVNARDSIDGAGTIRLTARRRDLSEAGGGNPGGAGPGRFVELAVEDTGPGLDGAARERIFDPLVANRTQGQGTGLGLAVVYGLARSHGGWVEVESEPGIGTTFRILLPAADERAGEEKPSSGFKSESPRPA